jgi:hypothetical protein
LVDALRPEQVPGGCADGKSLRFAGRTARAASKAEQPKMQLLAKV